MAMITLSVIGSNLQNRGHSARPKPHPRQSAENQLNLPPVSAGARMMSAPAVQRPRDGVRNGSVEEEEKSSDMRIEYADKSSEDSGGSSDFSNE